MQKGEGSPNSSEFLTYQWALAESCVWANKEAICLSDQGRCAPKSLLKSCNSSIYFHSKLKVCFPSNLTHIPLGFKGNFLFKFWNQTLKKLNFMPLWEVFDTSNMPDMTAYPSHGRFADISSALTLRIQDRERVNGRESSRFSREASLQTLDCISSLKTPPHLPQEWEW